MSRKSPRNRLNHERWLVSYADFITLLFAFFVVMYAFASVDRTKRAQVSAAINTAFGSLSITQLMQEREMNAAAFSQVESRARGVISPDPASAQFIRQDLERIQQDLLRLLSEQLRTGSISIGLNREGLVISLREAGFFTSGSAIPRPETMATLRQIGASLDGTSYDVRIEGHTDNVPIHSIVFDSNWELSSARATQIARQMLDMHTIIPERLSAAGYAQYHPVASNDTAEGRAQNRRVDLVIVPRIDLAVAGPEARDDKTSWRKIVEH